GLVLKITGALSDSRGAAPDYRSFISTLKSFGSCINTISGVLDKYVQRASASDLHEKALINGILHEGACTVQLLNAFLDDTYKYTASLLPKRESKKFEAAQAIIRCAIFRKDGLKPFQKAWREISWAVFKKEDVLKLERDLQGHIHAFQTYGIFLSLLSLSRIEKLARENAVVTRDNQVVLLEKLGSLVSLCNRTMPPQIPDRLNQQQPVFFLDALGRTLSLPRQMLVTIERFHRHLEIMFEGLPGHRKVMKKEYAIEGAEGGVEITADEWHSKVTAGSQIAMSVLFNMLSGASTVDIQSCPRCRTQNSELSSQEGMAECFNCNLVFRIVDTECVVELPDEDDTSQNQTTEARDSARSIDASTASNKQPAKKKRNTEEDAFRRIRYIRETLIQRKAAPASQEMDDDGDFPDTSHERMVPTTIEWNQGGKLLYVTGTFAGWNRKYRLRESSSGRFSFIIPLPPGTHHIKFIVDGEMRTSDDLPKAVDYGNILVNYIEVSADELPPRPFLTEEKAPSSTQQPSVLISPVEASHNLTAERLWNSQIFM
ncbi:hypothetical protein GP486_005499, partial [Trichoglossum hirsutum]